MLVLDTAPSLSDDILLEPDRDCSDGDIIAPAMPEGTCFAEMKEGR